MTTHEAPFIPPTDPSDIAEALTDVILFVDQQGNILSCNNKTLQYLPKTAPQDGYFWAYLTLATNSLAETLEKYPPQQIHEIPCANGRSFLLRIIPLAAPLAPCGGFIVIATDNRPIEALYESYEERLEDNIAAWSDSITLFNALFDTAKDATLLMDESGIILTANTAATASHAPKGQSMAGRHVETLLGKRFHLQLRQAMQKITPKEIRTKKVVALDKEKEAFPAEAILRKISFTDHSLYQLILHDLSAEEELREDLRNKKAKVKQMDIALRQVIRSVEEDRKELREHFSNQVKVQMLPALDRIAKADTAEIREGYKTIIEERLVDLTDEGSSQIDPQLLRLSPREVEICQLIQAGQSSKEIADFLNMAFETVQTHRKNIRKKLDLRGNNATLYQYLRAKPLLA